MKYKIQIFLFSAGPNIFHACETNNEFLFGNILFKKSGYNELCERDLFVINERYDGKM